MSAKEGYQQVLTGGNGNGTDGTTEGGALLSEEARLLDQGLSGLKSFSEAGSDADFINADEFSIIEYFADYDILQLKEDIENTPKRVHQYFNAILKGLDTITDEVVVRFLLFVLYNLVDAISSSIDEKSESVVRNGNLTKLMALLDSSKSEDVEMTSKILAHLSIISNAMPQNTIDAFMTWIQREMISKGMKINYALEALMIVLRDNKSRDAFQQRGEWQCWHAYAIRNVAKYNVCMKYVFVYGYYHIMKMRWKNLVLLKLLRNCQKLWKVISVKN